MGMYLVVYGVQYVVKYNGYVVERYTMGMYLVGYGVQYVVKYNGYVVKGYKL